MAYTGSLDANDPNGLLQSTLRKKKIIDDMKRSMELQAGDPLHTFSGATKADISGDESDLAESPEFGDEAQKYTQSVLDMNNDMSMYNRPDVTAKRNQLQANELALKEAPAKAQAAGALAVEQEKNRGTLAEKEAQNNATKELLGLSGGGGKSGGGLAGPGGSIKPSVNAKGEVSFTTTPMPALVQRAHNQLLDARDKTMQALDEAEKQYPGIFDAASQADSAAPGSAIGRLFSGLTGVGAGKYGGPMDRANAGIERANYTLGIPTPFSRLAQEASFGNIEQMAGQLPGVRGLATITPLFKEHQSRWGHETPAATVQRLMHMVDLMNGTLSTIEQGANASSNFMEPQ